MSLNRHPLRVPSPPRAGGLATVLIAVPDEGVRALIKHTLHSVEGVEAQFAANGNDAVRMIETRMPAVVIADVNLPDLDGFRLCRLLKLPLHSGTDQVPVVLVETSYRDVVAEHVARKAQAYAFLKLPEEIGLLPRTVELALHRLLTSPKDRQLLTHKGDVQMVTADDSLGHTLLTALELDGWRTERARSMQEATTAWPARLPQVLFVDVPLSGHTVLPDVLSGSAYDRPVVIAMLHRAEPDVLLELMQHGVDDYLILPCDPARVVSACGDARVKYNFRSMHQEFETHLIKLKSVSDYLELVITHSHEAIFTCDPTGVVKLWNKGAERVYGYEAEEIIGKNVDDYLDPPGFTRKSPSVVRLLQQRGSMTDPEVERQRKNGEVFPVSATYTLIKDESGEVLGFSVIERDVTPIKALENERIKSARLRAITQTAVTANDHINTPLGIILGYAQFLELKFAAADAQDKQALEVIQQQVHKIKGIMNKLKLISDPIVKNYSIEGVTMLDLSNSQLTSESAN